MSAPPDSSAALCIGPPAGELVEPALALALGPAADGETGPRAEAILRAAAAGDVSLAGLRAATRASRLVGAAWCQTMSGRVAVVEPPRLVEGEAAETVYRLAAAQTDYLQTCGVTLAQAVLPPDAPAAQCEPLRRQGYAQAAELLYLVYLAGGPADDEAAEGPLSFEPFQEDELPRLRRLVEETYEGSLDCPVLDDRREMDDVLAGYRATGQYDPARWLLVRREERDIGCLLLADHPEHDHWELVYMGVVPAQRGQGWGAKIAREAQRRTRQAGRERLVLAVDAANRPALAVYLQAGFELWNRRSVWLRFLSGQDEAA